MATIAVVLLAYPMAYFLAFRVTRHKMLWLILITIPFWTSYLLRVFAWKIILGFNGVINSGLISLGIIDKPLEFLLYSPFAVMITLAHAWAAFAILPIYVSLEKIDRSLLEAATDLGYRPLERFWHVTLPLSAPGTIATALLVFIPTVGDYVTPSLVGGSGGTMIGNAIQILFGRANDAPLGSALSLVMMLVVTLLVLRLPSARRLSPHARLGELSAPCATRLDLLTIYGMAFLVFLYAPVLLLPLFSFNDNIFAVFPLKGFTLQAYVELANNDSPAERAAQQPDGRQLASPSSAPSSACWRAMAVTRYRLPGRGPVMGVIMLPLVVPSIILARRPAHRSAPGSSTCPLTLWTVGAGHVLLCVPFSMLVLMSRLEGFDKIPGGGGATISARTAG